MYLEQMNEKRHRFCAIALLSRFKDQTTRYSIMLKDGREVPAIAHYSNLGESGHENGYILLALEPVFEANIST